MGRFGPIRRVANFYQFSHSKVFLHHSPLHDWAFQQSSPRRRSGWGILLAMGESTL
jgi:hypothetical protein